MKEECDMNPGLTIDEIKKEVLSNIEEYVTTTTKEQTAAWVQNTAMPALTEIVDAYVAALKASAKEETGWCKFRDALFLPALVTITLNVVKSLTNKVVYASVSKPAQ